MGKAIQQGGGHLGIAEDACPFGEAEVGGEPYQLRKVFTENAFKLEVVEPRESRHIDVRPQIRRSALVVFARDQEKLSYPELHKKYGIAQSTAHGDYQNASTLIGDEKTAFDKELQRLIGGQSPPESN